uniref:SH3 domain-containing protein n=1 Tax=Knipowitschia caucasica TaxID=637954 RepID=A0AAV2J0K1_KNICA
MENKSDLKAIMACFQANGSSMENSTSTGRPKATLPGQALHTKRPVPERDPKPTLPKPVNAPKPPWVKMDTSSTQPPTRTVPPALLKPNNNLFKLQEQMDSNALNIDSVNKPAPPTVPADMSTSKISAAQTLFNKEPAEQDNKMKMKPSAVSPPLQPSHSVPPPKPLASKKPSLKKPSAMMKDPSAPKRNPLLNSLALGPAPAKPNRPPHVDLQVYKRKLLSPATDPEKSIASPPPSSNHSNHVTLAPPPVPSLPPRHPGARNENEELYDDVDGLSSAPPPLPPVHPNQVSKEKDNDDEDGEMYEYLDERWEAAEPQQETRKVKDDKEGKKQVEAGKKEQKDREKKEQEARKKFKLVGSLDVLQKGKAVVDIKGSKTDLSLKQGDSLDIIRIHGNPEGKWLGRSQDGSIGYVKITSVKIDINVLKQQAAEQAYEPDIYDDIEMAAPETSTTKEPECKL